MQKLGFLDMKSVAQDYFKKYNKNSEKSQKLLTRKKIYRIFREAVMNTQDCYSFSGL